MLRKVCLAVPSRTALVLSCALMGATPSMAFSPPEIGGCVLWLKADAITGSDGDSVSSWADSSAAGNPATQGTPANQPTLRTGVLNGKPVVRFDGNDYLSTATSFGNPYTIFAVGRMQGSQNARLISSAQYNWLLGFWGGVMNVMYAEGWVVGGGGPPADTVAHIYSGRGTGANTTLRNNGALVASNANGISPPGQLGLGGWRLNNECSKGDVAEVIIYNSALSSNDEAKVGYYLQAKYGISGSYPAQGPVMASLPATNVTTTSASLNGAAVDIGAGAPTVKVYWGTTDGANNAGAWATNATFVGTHAAGPLTMNVTGLSANSLYYYRYYGINSSGDGWATNSQSLITAPLTARATDAAAIEWVPALGCPDTGTFTIYRPGWATNSALPVTYAMSGTAANGYDYQALSGTAAFVPGATNLDITVTPIPRSAFSGGLTVVLTLTGGAYPLGAMNSATVTVAEATSGPWYVRTNGSDSQSGTNWGEAFQTISNALRFALNGDAIYVSNGTYSVTQPLVVPRNIAVIGVGGAPNTTLNGGGVSRLLSIASPGAVVDGFTINNGWVTNANGGGVSMSAGTLSDCRITANRVVGSVAVRGGGVYMTGGAISNCTFSGNTVYSSATAWGGGVCMTGGAMIDSTIGSGWVNGANKDATATYGGGVYMSGTSLLRGCLVTNNFGYTYGWSASEGAGIYMQDSARVESCTVVKNECRPDAGSYGAGIRMTGGTVMTSLIDRNTCYSHYTFGGGVYMTGGQIVKSTVSGNYVGAGHVEEAAGVYQSAGTVDRCVISGNVAGPRGYQAQGGGGISLRGGVVQNSLIVSNVANSTHQGGGICQYAGTVQNCTIVGNSAVGDPGGGLLQAAGDVRNTIVYLNQGNPANASKVGGTFSYSCSTPPISGGSDVNNTDANPTFANAIAGNFRLLPGSPCIDTGTSVGATPYDLESKVRPVDGDDNGSTLYDMGAYEYNPNGGPLACNFNAAPTVGLGSLNAVFTAALSGDTTGLGCAWDFGNGTLSGAGRTVVTNLYNAVGRYTVSLRVTNGAGEVASIAKANYISIVNDADAYVSTNGSGTYPYDTWPKAASNIQDAVTVEQAVMDLGGSHASVWVGDGTYRLNGQTIRVDRSLTLKSLHGAAATVIDGTSNARGVAMNAAGAVLDGFTIQNAYVLEDGGAVKLSAGTVRNCRLLNSTGYKGGGIYMGSANCRVENCVITGNTSVDGAGPAPNGGGGIYVGGGIATNCWIAQNLAQFHHGRAGGANVNGGLLVDSHIVSNRVQVGHTSGACGALLSSGTIRNCVVTRNYEVNGDSDGGGGIYVSGGNVENCTVVANTVAKRGGGLHVTGGSVLNTIVYFNGSGDASPNVFKEGGTFRFSCSTPLVSGGSDTDNIAADPDFLNWTAGNYRIAHGSPCKDHGLNQSWMVGGGDVSGKPRIVWRTVDMGAYEDAELGTAIIMR